MALYPFILLKKTSRNDEVLLNHEKIHLRQQAEMLVIPFYIFYMLIYFFNLVKHGNHSRAYRNIIFEKEAFAHEKDTGYLLARKPFQFIKHV